MIVTVTETVTVIMTETVFIKKREFSEAAYMRVSV